jgi:transcription initiation factor TFIIB
MFSPGEEDDEKTSRARAGSPTNIARHDMGLSAIIGYENRDASGRSLSPSMRTTLERLRSWDKRTHSNTELQE